MKFKDSSGEVISLVEYVKQWIRYWREPVNSYGEKFIRDAEIAKAVHEMKELNEITGLGGTVHGLTGIGDFDQQQPHNYTQMHRSLAQMSLPRMAMAQQHVTEMEEAFLFGPKPHVNRLKLVELPKQEVWECEECGSVFEKTPYTNGGSEVACKKCGTQA